MADIRLVWNPASAIADIRIIDGQVETGQDLETAVLISLFTDHVVDTGDVLPDPRDNDPRGWWADTYEAPDLIGSKLWQVMGRIRNQDTLNFARDTAEKSLQWLIEDGIASAVDVTPSFYGKGGLRLDIQLTQARGVTQFSFVWDNLAPAIIFQPPIDYPEFLLIGADGTPLTGVDRDFLTY